MLEAKIRLASISDAKAMSKFAGDRFKDTFGHIYDPDDLREFIAEKYNEGKFAEYIIDKTMQNLLAFDDGGEIVGYSQAGAMTLPLDDAIDGAIELYRFYVGDEAKGTGLAKRLFGEVLEFANQKKAPALYLGVWSQNFRALAFYEKLGFEIVGKYLYQVGRTYDDERIMRLWL